MELIAKPPEIQLLPLDAKVSKEKETNPEKGREFLIDPSIENEFAIIRLLEGCEGEKEQLEAGWQEMLESRMSQSPYKEIGGPFLTYDELCERRQINSKACNQAGIDEYNWIVDELNRQYKMNQLSREQALEMLSTIKRLFGK